MQFSLNNLDRVMIDYDSPLLPDSVRLFKPVVYSSEQGFFCLYGEDFHKGVYGCGISQQEVITDWVNHLKQRLEGDINNDAFARDMAEAMRQAKVDFK